MRPPHYRRQLAFWIYCCLCLAVPRGQVTLAANPQAPLLDLALKLGSDCLVSRFGFSSSDSRLLVEAAVAGDEAPALRGGIASPYFTMGPLSPQGLCRFLLDPSGEGFRLFSGSARPFDLDGSLESSRFGLLLGGRAFGVGAWTGPGLSPVGSLWARAPPLGPVEASCLAQLFEEEPPEDRSWVDPGAIQAAGPAMHSAFGLGLGDGGSGLWLALGASEAQRGPRSAALRAEALVSQGALVLRGAVAATGRDWIIPGDRLGAAYMTRADLLIGRKEVLALGLGALATAGEGGPSETSLKVGLDGGLAGWSLGIDGALDVDRDGPTGLGADARLARRGRSLHLGLGAGIDLSLGSEAWVLEPYEQRRVRLNADMAYRSGALSLSAGGQAKTPEAEGASPPWSFKAGIELSSGLGALSGALDLASDVDAILAWTWSLTWKRRLALGAAP